MSTATANQKPPTIAQRTAEAAEKSARYLGVENTKLLAAVLAEVASDELRYNRSFADRVRVAYEASAPKPKPKPQRQPRPRAAKPKVTLVPIKDVGPHYMDITAAVDPYLLYEVFGAKQLPDALRRFSKKKLLEEAVPYVQKRHPGAQPPKSATLEGVIAFIVQRVVNG
jgi:hypothetical protein